MGKRKGKPETGEGRHDGGMAKRAHRSFDQSHNSKRQAAATRFSMQMKRINRALERAGGDKAQQVKLHLEAADICRGLYPNGNPHDVSPHMYAEALSHLEKCLVIDPSDKMHARNDIVLTLLDSGDAAKAREICDKHSEDQGTVFAWSRALIEFIAWACLKETDASEEKAEAALAVAVKANPYVGLFLAFQNVFTRTIDPDKIDSIPREKAVSGSVEEALRYAVQATSCWLDTTIDDDDDDDDDDEENNGGAGAGAGAGVGASAGGGGADDSDGDVAPQLIPVATSSGGAGGAGGAGEDEEHHEDEEGEEDEGSAPQWVLEYMTQQPDVPMPPPGDLENVQLFMKAWTRAIEMVAEADDDEQGGEEGEGGGFD